MAEVDYLHVCDFAFSGEGGKPCIIGLFDVINAAAFPTTHPLMFLALRLQGAPHEVVHGLRFEVSRPNGDVIANVPIPDDLVVSPDGTSHVHLRLINLVFPEEGRYIVKALLGNRALATRSIRLNQMRAPAPPPRAH